MIALAPLPVMEVVRKPYVVGTKSCFQLMIDSSSLEHLIAAIAIALEFVGKHFEPASTL